MRLNALSLRINATKKKSKRCDSTREAINMFTWSMKGGSRGKLIWPEQNCNMYRLKKTFLVGNDAVVLYFNSSRKVFNLKQIAFRETGNSLSVVNTQCNSHPGLSDLQITQLLIKSVSRISLYVFSLVHLHSSKVTKDWKGNCKAWKKIPRKCNKFVRL